MLLLRMHFFSSIVLFCLIAQSIITYCYGCRLPPCYYVTLLQIYHLYYFDITADYPWMSFQSRAPVYVNSDDAHACQYASTFPPQAPHIRISVPLLLDDTLTCHIPFAFGPYEGFVSRHISSTWGVATGADSRVTSASHGNSFVTPSKIVPS